MVEIQQGFAKQLLERREEEVVRLGERITTRNMPTYDYLIVTLGKLVINSMTILNPLVMSQLKGKNWS